jgi:divinyl chlorophyllide a 8-vinyl-reductase
LGCAGPGKAWTARDQGEFLFELAGRRPSFIQVPVALMDGIIAFLDALARVFPGLEARQFPLTASSQSA